MKIRTQCKCRCNKMLSKYCLNKDTPFNPTHPTLSQNYLSWLHLKNPKFLKDRILSKNYLIRERLNLACRHLSQESSEYGRSFLFIKCAFSRFFIWRCYTCYSHIAISSCDCTWYMKMGQFWILLQNVAIRSIKSNESKQLNYFMLLVFFCTSWKYQKKWVKRLCHCLINNTLY